MTLNIKWRMFIKEGVSLMIPYEDATVRVYQLPFASDEELGSEVKIIRKVINIKIVAEMGSRVPITSFDPPIELRVKYTSYDLQEGNGNLSLAYWDGAKWIRFTPEEHNYLQLPDFPEHPELGGIGLAYISEWADPNIAWVD